MLTSYPCHHHPSLSYEDQHQWAQTLQNSVGDYRGYPACRQLGIRGHSACANESLAFITGKYVAISNRMNDLLLIQMVKGRSEMI